MILPIPAIVAAIVAALFGSGHNPEACKPSTGIHWEIEDDGADMPWPPFEPGLPFDPEIFFSPPTGPTGGTPPPPLFPVPDFRPGHPAWNMVEVC